MTVVHEGLPFHSHDLPCIRKQGAINRVNKVSFLFVIKERALEADVGFHNSTGHGFVTLALNSKNHWEIYSLMESHVCSQVTSTIEEGEKNMACDGNFEMFHMR